MSWSCLNLLICPRHFSMSQFLRLALWAPGGVWLLARAMNNWSPLDLWHTMLKVLISMLFLRKYWHWFLPSHDGAFVAQRLNVTREAIKRMFLEERREEERRWVWRRSEHDRRSSPHWSRAEDVHITWSYSRGKCSVPNTFRVVLWGLVEL